MTFTLGKTRYAEGYFIYIWWITFLSSSFFSMYFLSRAVKTIPLGTAYPVWTGIGAVGTVIIGILVFREPVSFWRIFFITTLIISIVGLKLI